MNLDQLKRDLDAKKTAIESLRTKTSATCETENRAETPEETAAIASAITEAQGLRAKIDRAQGTLNQTAEIDRLTAGMITPASPQDVVRVRKSLGQQLVSHAAFTSFIKGGYHKRSGAWSSDPIDLELQATTVDTTSGSGGPLIIPQYIPGILPTLFYKPRIGDLLPQGTTDSNVIIYMRETLFTNNAAATTEGTNKPESALVFAQASAPVQKIAHFIPVSEEALEDISGIQSYIDARLQLGLQLVIDAELLNGSGTPPHLTGLLTTAGMTAVQARGSDVNADAIMKEITKIETTAFVMVDGIVINPANWQTIQLTKNANGNYLGTGPWAAPQTPTLWGLPVIVTPAIAAGTALVGGFRTCTQEFTKGPIRVEMTNSHNDFFIKNLIAIRCETRLALAVYRPAGLGTITGLA